jgi:hypothetical protein
MEVEHLSPLIVMPYSRKNILKNLLFDTIAKNKALLLHEAYKMNDFMGLLMKRRNTQYTWTKEEKKILQAHLWRLSSYIPLLIIFCLPFGSLLFPLLAEILDRRTNRRASKKQPSQRKGSDNPTWES